MECKPTVLNAVQWGDYPSYESQLIGRLLYFHDSRNSKWHNHLENIQPFYIWVVVSNMFLFPALFGEDSHFDEYFSNRLKPPRVPGSLSGYKLFQEARLLDDAVPWGKAEVLRRLALSDDASQAFRVKGRSQ